MRGYKMQIKVYKLYEAKTDLYAPGVTRKIFVDEKTPTQSLTLGYGMFEVGAKTGLHSHDTEEAFFIVHGYGAVVDAKGNEYKAEPGTVLYVPANCAHEFKNTSDAPLIFFYVHPKAKVTSTRF